MRIPEKSHKHVYLYVLFIGKVCESIVYIRRKCSVRMMSIIISMYACYFYLAFHAVVTSRNSTDL